MLRPTKHSHPDQTVIFVSTRLLVRLKEKRIEEFNNLQDYAKKVVYGGDVLFLSAINLLFILGLIEYRSKTDSFEYVGN